MTMFDANARYLDKGTLFFASQKGNLLYCEMLDDDHKNPRVKIITCHSGKSGYHGHIYQKHPVDWSFIKFEGWNKDGELRSFIDDKWKKMASEILERLNNKVNS